MSSSNEKLAALEWLRNDPNYFPIGIRIARDEILDWDLEAAWHGLWNSVLSWISLKMPVSRVQYTEVVPQALFLELKWGEGPLLSPVQSSAYNNSNDGADADDNSDDEADADYNPHHVNQDTDSNVDESESDGISDPDVDNNESADSHGADGGELGGQFHSLHIGSPSEADVIAALDNDSAKSTDSNSGPQSSSLRRHPEIGQRDKKLFPDWALILYHLPRLLPEIHRVYHPENSSIPSEYKPYQRLPLLVEIKRLPSQLITAKSEAKRLQAISSALKGSKLRKQIYQQVRAAFATFPKQDAIVHLSAVGDYCNMHRFERDVWMANDLIPRSERNINLTPTWNEMAGLPPSTQLSPMLINMQCIMSTDPNTQGINPKITAEIEAFHQELVRSIEEEHRELTGTNLF